MSGPWIKICGINRTEDAKSAARLGADGLGLILYAGSPRAVAVENCRQLLAGVGQAVTRIAVMVDPKPALVERAVDSGVIDRLQFHGRETAAFCQQFGKPYIKGIRVKGYSQAMREVEAHPDASMLLLDTYQQGTPGGTGKRVNWAVAARLVLAVDKPVILAGGLDPVNLTEAIAQVNPFGVDVVSGVEQYPGQKDMLKVKNFIRAGRHG